LGAADLAAVDLVLAPLAVELVAEVDVARRAAASDGGEQDHYGAAPAHEPRPQFITPARRARRRSGRRRDAPRARPAWPRAAVAWCGRSRADLFLHTAGSGGGRGSPPAAPPARAHRLRG